MKIEDLLKEDKALWFGGIKEEIMGERRAVFGQKRMDVQFLTICDQMCMEEAGGCWYTDSHHQQRRDEHAALHHIHG